MKSNISTVAMLALLMVTGSDRRMQFLPPFIALPGVQDPHCCFSEAPKKHLCAFLWREQVSFSWIKWLDFLLEQFSCELLLKLLTKQLGANNLTNSGQKGKKNQFVKRPTVVKKTDIVLKFKRKYTVHFAFLSFYLPLGVTDEKDLIWALGLIWIFIEAVKSYFLFALLDTISVLLSGKESDSFPHLNFGTIFAQKCVLPANPSLS